MARFFGLPHSRHCSVRLIVLRALKAAIALTVLLVLAGMAFAQTTCTVTSTADTTDSGTLRACITSADSGDTIDFESGLTGTITLTSALPTITNSLTITGPGASSLTISGANKYTVFTITSGTVSISGLTIANGYGAYGGGISITTSTHNSTLNVTNSTFSGNSATAGGGGIYTNTSGAGTLTLNVTNSTFSGNSAGSGGGIYTGSTLNVINSTFSGNSAVDYGGGIYTITDTLTVANSTFSGNSAANTGGIYNTGGTLTVANSVLTADTGGECSGAGCPTTGSTANGNIVGVAANLLPLGNYGGTTQTMLPLPGSAAICAGIATGLPSGVTLTSTDQRGFPLSASNCPNGGVDAGAVQTNYLTVTTAADPGAGSCPGSECSLRDAIAAADDEDIDFSTTAFPTTATTPTTITLGSGLTIGGQVNIIGPGAAVGGSSAYATVSGGGSGSNFSVFAVSLGAEAFLDGLTIANGYNASSDGGGITDNGTLTVTNSTFSGNSSSEELGGGGISILSGTLTVTNSTLSGNSASGDTGAGGISILGGTVTVTNSTFSGNSASGESSAGGISIFSTNPSTAATVTNSTFSGNSASGDVGAGGISDAFDPFPDALTVTNSIFSGNSSPEGIAGSILSPTPSTISYNVYYSNTAEGVESDCNGCTTNTNPVEAATNPLAVLAYNGGPTETFLPVPGSAAICAGSASLFVNAYGSSLTTDQRGAAHSGAYCTSSQVDAGSVQTDYQSIQFTNIPSNGTYTAAQGATPSPAPILSVTENNQSASGIPITLTDTGSANNTVTGLGPVTTAAGAPAAAGIGATFSSLQDSVAEETTLAATLQIISSASITTNPTAEFDVTAITISPAGLSPGTVGMAYVPVTLNATGGTSSYTYTISAGVLPAGMTLSGAGLLMGTPAAAGSFNFTVTATAANAATVSGAYTLTVNKAESAVSGTVPVLSSGQSASSTVTVTGVAGITPTGTVSYSIDGGAAQNVTLENGMATVPVPNTLAGGTQTIALTYSGDANYLGSTGTVSFTLSVALNFSLTPNGAESQTAIPGGTATYSFQISPTNGAYPANVTFAATGLPAGASADFSPATIAADGGAQTVTVQVQTAATTATQDHPFERGGAPLALGFLLLPLLGVRRMHRTLRGAVLLLLVAAGIAGAASLSGCSSANGFYGQAVKNYGITVTATSGSVQHTLDINLNLQ